MDTSRDLPASKRVTKRELECLRLTHQGLASKEIAVILKLSPHTVDNHIKSALHRLDVPDRRRAARIVVASEASDPLARDWLDQTLALVRAGGEVLHQVVQEQQESADREGLHVEPTKHTLNGIAPDFGLRSEGGDSGIPLEEQPRIHRLPSRWSLRSSLLAFWRAARSGASSDRFNAAAEKAPYDVEFQRGHSPTRFERLILVIAAVCGLLMTVSLVVNVLIRLLHAIHR